VLLTHCAQQHAHWCGATCGAGDAVALILPMTPTAVAAYLGLVLAGCSVIGIADSFSASEVAMRLRISRATLLITQAGGAPVPWAMRKVFMGRPAWC